MYVPALEPRLLLILGYTIKYNRTGATMVRARASKTLGSLGNDHGYG